MLYYIQCCAFFSFIFVMCVQPPTFADPESSELRKREEVLLHNISGYILGHMYPVHTHTVTTSMLHSGFMLVLSFPWSYNAVLFSSLGNSSARESSTGKGEEPGETWPWGTAQQLPSISQVLPCSPQAMLLHQREGGGASFRTLEGLHSPWPSYL